MFILLLFLTGTCSMNVLQNYWILFLFGRKTHDRHTNLQKINYKWYQILDSHLPQTTSWPCLSNYTTHVLYCQFWQTHNLWHWTNLQLGYYWQTNFIPISFPIINIQHLWMVHIIRTLFGAFLLQENPLYNSQSFFVCHHSKKICPPKKPLLPYNKCSDLKL